MKISAWKKIGGCGLFVTMMSVALMFSLTILAAGQEAAPASPLQGKRICIDPGHGGAQTGAVGKTGLKESDINLVVSKYLKDMLEAEGATVFLTRDDDSAISLGERCEFNKAHDTDLFVSIHHNANAQGDTSMNRTEVFYHWKDRGGPSKDAAYHVYRELQETFDLPDSKVYMCWAYGVLRENSYPAILGEASYLQNPEEEQRLEDKEYLRGEAAAYFRGIKAFFEGGRPAISLDKDFVPAGEPSLRANVERKEDTALVDPQRFTVEHDGTRLSHRVYNIKDHVLYFHVPEENHLSGEIALAARNLAGHVSNVERVRLESLSPKSVPARGIAVDVMIFTQEDDADSKSPFPGAEVISKETVHKFYVADDKGHATLHFSKEKPGTIHVKAPGFHSTTLNLNDIEPVETAEGKRYEVMLSPIFQGALHGKKIVLDPEGGGDDPGAIGDNGLRAATPNLETCMYLADYLRHAGATVWLTRTIDKCMDNVSRVRFGLERNPDVFLTVGHRRPEPGMGEEPGQNASRCGARWSSGRELSKTLVFHLRELLDTGEELGDVTSREPLPTEEHNWSSWEVMHGAQKYTAVYACPQMFDAPGVQERLTTTACTRKEALGLVYGLLDYFGLDDRNMCRIEGKVVDAKSKEALGDALLVIDNDIPVQTEPDGTFLLKYIDPLSHTIRVRRKGYQRAIQSIELDEEQHLDLTIAMDKE